MKKFLFVTFMLACFVSIKQTNAQAIVENKVYHEKEVTYEVDGETVVAIAVGYRLMLSTPSDNWKWVFQGELPEGTPLPKKTVIYYDPFYNNEKVTITPSGKVKVVVLVRDAWWLED